LTHCEASEGLKLK